MAGAELLALGVLALAEVLALEVLALVGVLALEGEILDLAETEEVGSDSVLIVVLPLLAAGFEEEATSDLESTGRAAFEVL